MDLPGTDPLGPHIGHVQPRARAGSDSLANLALGGLIGWLGVVLYRRKWERSEAPPALWPRSVVTRFRRT